MQTVLNTIIDNSRAAAARGLPRLNPYPAGTLRHIAYELGQCEQGTVTLFTSDVDAASYAVATTSCGQFKCIVPAALASRGLGEVHPTLADAVGHLRDLAISHSAQSIAPLAA